MTTSWNETKQIEAHLQGTTHPGDALLFEARLVLDNTLADKVMWQQKAYGVIQQYGRRQLKKRLNRCISNCLYSPLTSALLKK
ncbi:hypothetical protein [Mucilaginibacter antarcticus]|uniref:hypothetical protein n=1 Tax=Mucilaginibacter antarcticus TaxID=1855725 RepID=UPI00362FAE2D